MRELSNLCNEPSEAVGILGRLVEEKQVVWAEEGKHLQPEGVRSARITLVRPVLCLQAGKQASA